MKTIGVRWWDRAAHGLGLTESIWPMLRMRYYSYLSIQQTPLIPQAKTGTAYLIQLSIAAERV